jgi:hypothetical protein
MSSRSVRPREVRRCPTGGRSPSRKLAAAGQRKPRPPWLRYLREHGVALAVIGLVALIALPPAVLAPSGEIELVATGAATLLACALVGLICHESLRR